MIDRVGDLLALLRQDASTSRRKYGEQGLVGERRRDVFECSPSVFNTVSMKLQYCCVRVGLL